MQSHHVKKEKPIDLSALARELGRKGGASKSEKKRLAAQINGKLGGRPKKKPLEESQP